METGQQSGFPAAVRYPSLQRNSSSDIALVPYAKVGDEWTLSDDAVLSLAVRAENENVLETVFMDGTVQDPTDFIDMMQKPENLPVFVFSGTECVGAGWLNGCIGRVAFAHFLLLRNGRGQFARRAGKLVLDYWRSFKVENERLFEVIIGVVPSSNERAISFVQELGFVRLGEIPKMLRSKPATLLYLTE
jgi:hypothetical protein